MSGTLKCAIHKPDPLLAGHVKYYYVLDHELEEGVPAYERITPDGCIELNFMFSDGHIVRRESSGATSTLDRCYVVSRLSRPYLLFRQQKVSMIGACFFPWAIKPLIDIPLARIADRAVDQSSVFGSGIRGVQHRIMASGDPATALHALETYLLTELCSPARTGIDTMVAGIARRILISKGSISIGDLYAGSSYSKRRIQQKFKECLGVSPRSYSRLVKFNHALEGLLIEQRRGHAQLALEHGYYDQPHFIREFTDLAGIPPSAYLKEKHEFNDLILRADSV